MNESMKVPVEVFSRVTGYFRPITQWNPGKKSEIKNRLFWHKEDVIKALDSTPLRLRAELNIII
jgi:hypothetical protein